MRKVSAFAILFFLLSAVIFADFADFYYSISPEEDRIDPNVGLTLFPTLLVPSGGRYEGMGTAFTAVADDSGYLEANPSASSLLEYTELVFSHNNWIADSNMEGVVYTIRFNDLGLGFGGKFLYVPFTEYDTWGERVSKGYFTETIGTMNISYNFFSSYYFYGIAFGTNIKVAYRSIPAEIAEGQSLFGVMADIGVLTRFNFLKYFASRSKNVSLGAVVKNLGPPVPLSAERTPSEPLPTEATFGMSYSPIRPVTIAFDLGIPFSLVPAYPAERPNFAAGFDVVFTDFYSLQAGFKYRGANPKISLGSIIELKAVRFAVNYTFDLTTSSQNPDHFSIQAELKIGDRGRAEIQALIDEYYTAGLEAYAEGSLVRSIEYWDKVLELDPHFQPAREMKKTAQRALLLQQKMEALQQIE